MSIPCYLNPYEFLFRDAKQFTGLSDCQARDQQKSEFHFNASLSALNLAKLEVTQQQALNQPFSRASYKRQALNEHLLEMFIAKLDLQPDLIKNHPNYQELRSYGAIAS